MTAGFQLVAAPDVQVQVAATLAGEQERRVDPRRELGERRERRSGQGDGAERPALLAVQLHLAVREDAADVQ